MLPFEMARELIDVFERVLEEAVTQDPFQEDRFALVREAEALLAKAKVALQNVQTDVKAVAWLDPLTGEVYSAPGGNYTVPLFRC
jgi:hypothetical protein